jgi:histidinol-phosphate phosphatase family protein
MDYSEEDLNRVAIDSSWTLFLDRDGVLNEEAVGSYITSWPEFVFSEGVLPAVKDLTSLFGTTIIVTNQRGVGRGLMTLETLRDIHRQMRAEIELAGGRIDKIYAATALETGDHNRKPNIGMGIQSREDFPHIDFHKSVIVGNSLSDMEFGKRLGMRTIFLHTTSPALEGPHPLVDEQFESLQAWAASLEAIRDRRPSAAGQAM